MKRAAWIFAGILGLFGTCCTAYLMDACQVGSCGKDDDVSSKAQYKENKVIFGQRNLVDIWNMYPLNIMNGTKLISSECKQAYDNYLNDLQRNDLNAVKMFDASAKLPSGILKGNVNQYGNYDECMEVKDGQYCLAEIDIRPLWKNPYSKFQEMAHSHFVIQETLDDVW